MDAHEPDGECGLVTVGELAAAARRTALLAAGCWLLVVVLGKLKRGMGVRVGWVR